MLSQIFLFLQRKTTLSISDSTGEPFSMEYKIVRVVVLVQRKYPRCTVKTRSTGLAYLKSNFVHLGRIQLLNQIEFDSLTLPSLSLIPFTHEFLQSLESLCLLTIFYCALFSAPTVQPLQT